MIQRKASYFVSVLSSEFQIVLSGVLFCTMKYKKSTKKCNHLQYQLHLINQEIESIR